MRTPDTFDAMHALKALPRRLWSKILLPQSPNDCWIWIATKTPDGYGEAWDGHRLARAHRFTYTITIGPIPLGLDLDHLCRTPSCVNPAHLEPVTRSENIRRGDVCKPRTHCPNGHEMTPENTIWVPSEQRKRCRLCTRKRQQRHYRKRFPAVMRIRRNTPPRHQ